MAPSSKPFLIGALLAGIMSLAVALCWPYKEKPVRLNPGAEIAVFTCSSEYISSHFNIADQHSAGTFILKDKTSSGPAIYLANPLWLGHELEHAADALYLGDWWEAARRASTKDFNVYFSETDKDLIKEKKLNVPRHAPVWP